MYRILLVEDDEAMLFLYARMQVFADCGFQLAKQVEDGRQALGLLHQERFDVLLTDIRMPFVDGLELLRQMRRQEIIIPAVLVSSYSEFEYARQGMILGAVDYVVKPVTEAILRETLLRIRTHLETGSTPDRHSALVQQTFAKLGCSIENNVFLQRLCSFLSAHLQGVATMEQAAEYMGLSKDHFGKTCHRHTGMAFGALYHRVRMAYAKQLLLQGDYKTYEISELLGYGSPDYFTKTFKEITGMTPSAYKLSCPVEPRQ